MLRSNPTTTQSSATATVGPLPLSRTAIHPGVGSVGAIAPVRWRTARLGSRSARAGPVIDTVLEAGQHGHLRSELLADSNLLRTGAPQAKGQSLAGPSGAAANASRLAVNHNPPSTTSV